MRLPCSLRRFLYTSIQKYYIIFLTNLFDIRAGDCMPDRDLVFGLNDENDIDLYEEKKKLPFAVKMVLLSIAAVAVVAIVIYAITWYMRPTVEELQAYNNLQNLLYLKILYHNMN